MHVLVGQYFYEFSLFIKRVCWLRSLHPSHSPQASPLSRPLQKLKQKQVGGKVWGGWWWKPNKEKADMSYELPPIY